MSGDLTYKLEYESRDETCTKCDRVFTSDQHFVRCDDENCPMKSGESILDILFSEEDE